MQDGDVFQGELFRRRIVMVIGVLNEPLALRVAAQLMTLDASGDDPVDMYLDCREGTLEAAFVLIDTLELMQATTRTHALGEVGGPALGVFAAGRQRVAAPNARFHLSEPKMQANGNADEIVARRSSTSCCSRSSGPAWLVPPVVLSLRLLRTWNTNALSTQGKPPSTG